MKDFERVVLTAGEENVAEDVQRGDRLGVSLVLQLHDAAQLLLGRRWILLLNQRVPLYISLILLLIKITYATRRSRPHMRPSVRRREVPVDVPALRVRFQS